VDPAYALQAQGDVRGLGFDPYNGLGRLDDRFSPGVHDSVGPDYKPPRQAHETAAAEALAREGADVRLTREDHTQHSRKSIDAYVRWDRDDVGTGTELKSLVGARDPSRAMKDGMLRGGKQLSNTVGTTKGVAAGQVLIDGRQHGPTRDEALHACQRAVGEANAHGRVLPGRVLVVLGDDSLCVFRPAATVDAGGRVSYARPDERPSST
jgi:hypothetical protein